MSQLIDPNSQESAPKTMCPICGRPVPARKGTRGAKKLQHNQCSVLRSRLELVKSLLEKMEFESDHEVKRMRGDIQAIMNHTLHKSNVKMAPGSDLELELSECK